MNRPLQPTVPPSTAEPAPGDDQINSPVDGAAESHHVEPKQVDEELETLRRLLLDDSQISDLRRRLDDPNIRAGEAAKILADAVRRAASGDPELAVALRPLVESGLHESVRRNPAVIIDTIYPVLGPAIRKAVASAVRGMVESLNQVAEHSFTMHGLRWRMEAWRTGQPVAEVALKYSVIYRVEQVLLIHRETGLLLQSVGADPAARDQDLVSGMLTAIQDFVHDSFSVDRDQDLDRLEIGDFQVWIERGPRAALAAVIRGSAPRRLRATLSDALAAVHRDMRMRLEKFDGDAAPFEAVRPALEECLEQEFKENRKGFSPAFVALCGLLALVLGFWGFGLWRESRRWSYLTQVLEREPGLVLVERHGDYASVLRDPLARHPSELAAEAGFEPGEPNFELRPYLSFDAPIFERRARNILHAPEGVRLRYSDGVLKMAGEAPRGWIGTLPALTAWLPGVDRLDTSGLTASDDLEPLNAAVRRANEIQLEFDSEITTIGPNQADAVAALASAIQDAEREAAKVGRKLEITVVGRADESGEAAYNARLSQQRAAALQAALGARGLRSDSYSTRTEMVEAGRDRTASVEIRVAGATP
ncbi:MAG: OmpA family protein [Bryobacterales bacterium]